MGSSFTLLYNSVFFTCNRHYLTFIFIWCSTSCGVFMLKFAELVLSGVDLPWIHEFGQKNIPSIRNAMALDVFVNGEIVNPIQP